TDVVTATLTASPAGTSEDGGAITYTVTLTGAPGSDRKSVVQGKSLANGGHGTIASGAHTGSTVTNVNQDDVYKETDSITNHITSVSSGGHEYESVLVNCAAVSTVINHDTDVVTATLTASPAGTSEDGGAITYTVTLTGAPG